MHIKTTFEVDINKNDTIFYFLKLNTKEQYK